MSLTNRLLDWWHSLHGSFPETIEQGAQGKTVEMWQTVIDMQPVDGSFGPLTDSMTRAWQSAHGIDPDGVVGPLTWTAAMKTVGNASTPKASSGPPVGTRPLPQNVANRPAITSFAIEVLNNKAVPMGGMAQRQIDDVNVVARIEPHTWTHRNGKLVTGLNPPIRGVTLYQVTDSQAAGFGADEVVWRVSEHGADPSFTKSASYEGVEQPKHRFFDYGSTDGGTDRLGGGMLNVGRDPHNKKGKLRL